MAQPVYQWKPDEKELIKALYPNDEQGLLSLPPIEGGRYGLQVFVHHPSKTIHVAVIRFPRLRRKSRYTTTK